MHVDTRSSTVHVALHFKILTQFIVIAVERLVGTAAASYFLKIALHTRQIGMHKQNVNADALDKGPINFKTY